jgi:uncharacterized membrane protein
MIRKVSYYWILLTLMLVDSWLLSKPNLLGKIGLIIYKYHYLRSFPRTLLTVWIVVSISVLVVLLVQFLMKRDKLSRLISTAVLAAFFIASVLIMTKVVIDFTSWSYSHTGLKFRLGAYLLPAMLMIIFGNGIIQLQAKSPTEIEPNESQDQSQVLTSQQTTAVVSPDTSLP